MRWSEVDPYGNSLAEWLLALGILTGSLLILLLLRVLLRKRVKRDLDSPTDIPQFLLDLLQRTNLVLLFFPVLYMALRSLDLPHRTETVLRVAAILGFLLQGAIWLSGFADFWFGRYKRNHQNDPSALTTITAVGFMAKIALWAIILLVALDNLGFNVTALVTGLGVGGVAVALATQNILGDLFASLSIVVDKPFVIGDLITVGEQQGTVEYIGLKTTRLRSVNGEQIIFGNGDLLKSVIRNMQRVRDRRLVFRFNVDLGVRPDQLAAVAPMVKAVVSSHPELKFEHAIVQRITNHGVEFEATTYVVSTARPYADVQHDVYVELFRRLRGEGIDFAPTPHP
jgi:small-conductance mechanosensitive channel